MSLSRDPLASCVAPPEACSGAALLRASAAPPPAAQVRREIWRSLVSMLRVYAQAAAVNHGPFEVKEGREGKAVVISGEGELLLTLESESGEGSWERWSRPAGREGGDSWAGGPHSAAGSASRPGASGRFTILADGRLDFDGEEKQLDGAAIDWVESLTLPLAGGRPGKP